LQKRKVFSLEWKSEGVMDNENGDSMEREDHVDRRASVTKDKERVLQKG